MPRACASTHLGALQPLCDRLQPRDDGLHGCREQAHDLRPRRWKKSTLGFEPCCDARRDRLRPPRCARGDGDLRPRAGARGTGGTRRARDQGKVLIPPSRLAVCSHRAADKTLERFCTRRTRRRALTSRDSGRFAVAPRAPSERWAATVRCSSLGARGGSVRSASTRRESEKGRNDVFPLTNDRSTRGRRQRVETSGHGPGVGAGFAAGFFFSSSPFLVRLCAAHLFSPLAGGLNILPHKTWNGACGWSCKVHG